MKTWTRILLAALAVSGAASTVACSNETGETESSTGTMRMPLTTISTSGAQYNLRNATFQISGSESATLRSEEYLSETGITLDLEAGDYLVTLHDGWRLEVVVDGVTEEVQAELVSSNPLAFTVSDQGETDVNFQFRAGDDVILLGDGRLNLGFEVDDGLAGVSCGDATCNASAESFCCRLYDYASEVPSTSLFCAEEPADCTTTVGVDRGLRIACRDSSSCDGGQLCCRQTVPNSSGTDFSLCQDNCDGSYEDTVCASDADCEAGQVCEDFYANTSWDTEDVKICKPAS